MNASIYIYNHCIHVCMFICMYVCTYVRTYVCMYVCMYLCMYVRMYVCMCMCIYIILFYLVDRMLCSFLHFARHTLHLCDPHIKSYQKYSSQCTLTVDTHKHTYIIIAFYTCTYVRIIVIGFKSL